MLDEIQFQNWCQSSKLPEQTIELIKRIRESPPSRNVQGGGGNVCGRYASRKMRQTIQFESGKVELANVYEWEYDPDVLEYWDQPEPFKISYKGKNNKTVAFYYTADFFIIGLGSAGYVECKPENKLQELAATSPNRYIKDENGRWRCPPAEEFASAKGLYYRIISSSEIEWIYQRNLRFLKGYIENSDAYIGSNYCTKILEYIKENPGCSIKELVSVTDMPVDTFYSMIVQGHIWLDINSIDLEDKSHIYLYRTPQGAIACTAEKNEEVSLSVSIRPGEKVVWCKKTWRIISDNNLLIEILDERTSELRTIDRPEFISLVKQGEVKNVSGPKPPLNAYMNERIRNASENDWNIAIERLQLLKPLITDGKYPETTVVTQRTLRNWLDKYKEAERFCDYGLLGLLPCTYKKGNSLPKLPDTTIKKMDELISKKYETPEQKTEKMVYGDLVKECDKLGITSPSIKTFSLRIKNRPKYNTELNREGERAAYEYEEIYHGSEYTTPKHGSRPFERVHIDHTELPLELLDSRTGKNADKAWITCMIDAFTRNMLAFYLTYEEPSYRSCMAVIRDCVKRHGRMPETIVVDNGKEFHSKYFQQLCAAYECTIEYRPPSKPRFGAICEKLMATTQTELINNLTGNTKIMKNVRQVSKSNNPKNLAAYTLEDLHDMMEKWIINVYHRQNHPALGQSPAEAFAMAMREAGNRSFKIIPYDELFLILTSPSTRKGTAKVSSNKGVFVNGRYYWSDAFKKSGVDGTSVPIRYDPFNMGIIYAYVGGWVTCTSEYYLVFKDRTEKELKVLAAEMRKDNKNHSKSQKITAKMMAENMDYCESKKLNKTKMQARENLKLVKNTEIQTNPNNTKPRQKQKIDPTKLPHFGEY